MNNLGKMKKSICKQIEEMDVEKLYDFLLQIEVEELDILSLDDILTCTKCRELYGYPCAEPEADETPCFERFKHYCEQE